MLRGAWSVLCFEWNRSLTIGRMFTWSVLALFPPGLLALVRMQEELPSEKVMGAIAFALIPEVVCLLGLLLWATPLVHAELEGRTWIYLAVRPGGRIKVLLGKYLTAVAWTLSASLLATTFSVLVLYPSRLWQTWWVLSVLCLLSCLAYGSLYALFAALFHRRAMVFAVAYTLILEFLVTFIPAMINQLTIQFRLRSLLFNWMGWLEELDENADIFLSRAPAWQHVLILLLVTFGLLIIASQVITRKEYVTAEEV